MLVLVLLFEMELLSNQDVMQVEDCFMSCHAEQNEDASHKPIFTVRKYCVYGIDLLIYLRKTFYAFIL